MNDNGYVYALMNPSIKGMVKIGKTTRTPEERAKELSASTGVPTPFIVVYNSYFEKCSEAEIFIHTYLENHGYRVSNNREFFEIEVEEAINAILKARDFFGDFKKSNNINSDKKIDFETNENNYDNLEVDTEPWKASFITANNFYTGDNDEIQDYEEALKYYLISIKLGSLESFSIIGNMHKDGIGVKKDIKEALNYFKQAIKNGYIECWADMATLYTEEQELENAEKSWNKYFLNIQESEISIINCYSYIFFIFTNNLNLKHREILNKRKQGIEHLINQLVDNEALGANANNILKDLLNFINTLEQSSLITDKIIDSYKSLLQQFVLLNYNILLKDFYSNNTNILEDYMISFLETSIDNSEILDLILTKSIIEKLLNHLETLLCHRAIIICSVDTLKDTYLDFIEICNSNNQEIALENKLLKFHEIIFNHYIAISQRDDNDIVEGILDRLIKSTFSNENNIIHLLPTSISYSLYHEENNLINKYNEMPSIEWKLILEKKAQTLCEKNFSFLNKKHIPTPEYMITPIIQYVEIDKNSPELYKMKVFPFIS